MFEFILVAQGIKKIYQIVAIDFTEEDFFPLTASQIQKLGTNDPHYMLNPKRLKDEYKLSVDGYILSESQKALMLKARQIIFNRTKDLPEDSTLQERLLYAKRGFPPVFFESKDK